MTTPPNLRQLAGNRYRLGHDPAYCAEHGEQGRTDDPWLMQIPGRRGHIYPHGAGRLGVATNSRGSTAREIAALPEVIVEQDGADGINASFPVELFEQVAQLIGARRRRRLSPEQRQAAAQRLASFRYSSARQSDLSSQNPLLRATDDQSIAPAGAKRSQARERRAEEATP